MPSPETIDAILADFHSFALRAATVDHLDIHPEAVLLLCDKIKAAVEQARAKYEHMHECFWNVDSIQNIVRQMLDERDDLRDQNPKASEVVAHFARLLIKAATPAPGNADLDALERACEEVLDGNTLKAVIEAKRRIKEGAAK